MIRAGDIHVDADSPAIESFPLSFPPPLFFFLFCLLCITSAVVRPYLKTRSQQRPGSWLRSGEMR